MVEMMTITRKTYDTDGNKSGLYMPPEGAGYWVVSTTEVLRDLSFETLDEAESFAESHAKSGAYIRIVKDGRIMWERNAPK
jgi:hypothetical protein